MRTVTLAEQLKDRLPYPLETIAVAVAFSPRYKSVIKEAARFARSCKAKLILIHIGDFEPGQERKLLTCIEQSKLHKDYCRIISQKGPTVKTILSICKENIVDLLVLGAIKREPMLTHYVGSVARKISRKAKCSVLLLTDPHERPRTFRKIAVSVIASPKTATTMATAVYIANIEDADELFVVNEEYLPLFESALADSTTDKEHDLMKKEIVKSARQRIDILLDQIPGSSSVRIKSRVIFGKPGHSVQVFAKNKKPDLLIVNSPKKYLGILDLLFPHDLEYILEDLPCNLMIVHSRGF